MRNLKDQLIKKAEELGWKVTISEGHEWEFKQSSPAGEDFFFSINANEHKEVWREVRRYANDFDPDEHIEMWVLAKYQGGKNIPSIRKLVEDADDINEMLDKLADALYEVTEFKLFFR